MAQNAYDKSILLTKIIRRKNANKPLKIAFLDIDFTMTGNYKTSNITRKKLERLGYGIVYVTARTEEMLMTSESFAQSKAAGFDRPEPHLGRLDGKRVYVHPELIEPAGILDPDIIAGSTGTQILVRQLNGAYLADSEHDAKIGMSPAAWRAMVFNMIDEFNLNGKRAFIDLREYDEQYEKGINDVLPPKYRLTLAFEASKHMRAFRSFIRSKRQNTQGTHMNIRLINDINMDKGQFIIQLTPKHGSKTKAVDHIIDSVCEHANIRREQLQILMAGDSFPDLDMGLKAAKGTQATFLLVGGSMLAHALTCINKHDSFDEIIGEDKDCLQAMKLKGFYTYELLKRRSVIVGDEAFKGKKGVDTVLAYLTKEYDST